MNILKYKKIYYIISIGIILPGLISLLLFGLKPAIDFTGGSEIGLQIESAQDITPQAVERIVRDQGFDIHSVSKTADNQFMVRTQPLSEKDNKKIIAAVRKSYPETSEKSFETVGATIGQETTVNALKAVGIASAAILLYIAFVFRKVSKPVSSWKYGLCAVIALLHDALLVLGLFSLLGYFFNVEVDSLFITALLTVMGFSVHDTIVVFDRIRENLKRHADYPFEKLVNNSTLETVNRSLNTSVTVALVLFMLLLFGGESIRWFIVALLVGVISGTYSSIFTASPLLVSWYEFDKRSFSANKHSFSTNKKRHKV